MSGVRVHDRRSADVLKTKRVEYAPMEVDDPFAPGEKITVLRQLRHDQLAFLHTHHTIDDAQYEAGRRYQHDWEVAEQGARAIDPTREQVDGGPGVDPLPVKQMEARNKLVAIERVLGRKTVWIVQMVLVHGATLQSISDDKSKAGVWFTGRLFRAALEELACEYGLSHKRYHERRKVEQPEVGR